MQVAKTIRGMQGLADQTRRAGRRIGLVPTMGYFHEGHLSLMRIARERADLVVVSLFVNPTQFGPNEDLSRYPRDFPRDAAMAREAGVDVLFAPDVEEMYPEGYQTQVAVPEVARHLCGASRPGHFAGVATVCTKLFNAVKPHLAVFGEKDWQQLQVIRRLVLDLNLDLEIVPGPLVREPDGLAMSSRNVYLSSAEREAARAIHRGLLDARERYRAGERDARRIEAAFRAVVEREPLLRVDYATVSDAASCTPLDGAVTGAAVLCVAVFAGKTRLIDNILLDERGHAGAEP